MSGFEKIENQTFKKKKKKRMILNPLESSLTYFTVPSNSKEIDCSTRDKELKKQKGEDGIEECKTKKG